jgi:ArsR family transcriptional regulator
MQLRTNKLVFKALADETRLSILGLICLTPHGIPVTALAQMLSLSQPLVSSHLRRLEDAGLLTRHQSGRQVVYRGNEITFLLLLEDIGILLKGIQQNAENNRDQN